MMQSTNQSKPQTTTSNDKLFKSANEFSLYIEEVVKHKRVSYMDAVLDYCKENYLDPEDISKMINKSLKDKIEMDFRELNYLPKQAQLDV